MTGTNVKLKATQGGTAVKGGYTTTVTSSTGAIPTGGADELVCVADTTYTFDYAYTFTTTGAAETLKVEWTA